MPALLLRRACALFVLLLAGGSALAAGTEGKLQPFVANYSITWHGMSAGTTQVKLEHLPDGRWAYSSHSTARGLFRLAMPAELGSRSVLRIQDDKIIPETFSADDGEKDDENDQDILFDWATGRVHGTAEGKKVDLPIQPGLLDTLSVQVALMHALLGGHTPDRFVLLDKDRIKEYLYAAQGKERVQTDAGTYDSMIFRSSRPGSRNGTFFWCAPELGYLPLKVERREGKDVQWSMRLRSVTRN